MDMEDGVAGVAILHPRFLPIRAICGCLPPDKKIPKKSWTVFFVADNNDSTRPPALLRRTKLESVSGQKHRANKSVMIPTVKPIFETDSHAAHA
jgi:hypothetical protein